MQCENYSFLAVSKQYHLVLGGANFVLKMEHEHFGKHENSSAEQIDVDVSKIAYNSLSGGLFVADNFKKVIFTFNLTTSEMKPLVKDYIGNVSCLVFGTKMKYLQIILKIFYFEMFR